MTDIQFHNRLFNLTAELARASSARPYDPDAYNAVIDELNELSQMPICPRRRRDWIMICMLIFFSLVLAWIIYDALFFL